MEKIGKTYEIYGNSGKDLIICQNSHKSNYQWDKNGFNGQLIEEAGT